MMTSPRMLPAVAGCLERAEFYAVELRDQDARDAFAQAVALDSSPKSLHAFALYLMSVESWAEAETMLFSLLQQAQREQNWQLLFATNQNLAIVARERGQKQAARVYQQQAWAVWNERESREELSETDWCDLALNTANEAITFEDYLFARRLLHRVVNVYQQCGNAEGEADAWATLGVVNALEGDHKLALKFLWRAFHLHDDLKDVRNQAQDLMNIAMPLGQLGFWQSAALCLQLATNRLETLQAPQLLEKARLLLKEADAMRSFSDHNPLNN